MVVKHKPPPTRCRVTSARSLGWTRLPPAGSSPLCGANKGTNRVYAKQGQPRRFPRLAYKREMRAQRSPDARSI
ncbi:hypothetical protein RRG08_033799 [Elysia crispata]|uniref:Uncharacterized protein n=1 Tax=Elysia crispata TaxID=231223 RepID=A0AAE1B946_9GAST|nr:hypothetical protein RRG08_033799 [Elysia crispata]